MTPAQAAAFRLLSATPRERIHTHVAKRREPTVYVAGVKREPRSKALQLREWIRQHMSTMSRLEMAKAQNTTATRIANHMRVIRGEISPHIGRPRKCSK